METKSGRQVLCRMFFNPRVLCTSILTHSFFITAATQNAIEVAAQCVDQAFSCASQNLDSVGLPLTPRLAEYIRYVRYTLFPKKKVAVKDRVSENVTQLFLFCPQYFRSRLKGCEGEVAALLSDRWSHVTLDWQSHDTQNGDTPVNEN